MEMSESGKGLGNFEGEITKPKILGRRSMEFDESGQELTNPKFSGIKSERGVGNVSSPFGQGNTPSGIVCDAESFQL